MSYRDDLLRIEQGLDAAVEILRDFTPGAVEVAVKDGGDPVTEADRRVNDVLLRLLPRKGEGWLSEETVDDRSRRALGRVWTVDPLDGTREFIAGIPEWCVSIGLVEDGRPVAGGIENPGTGERVLGVIGAGAWRSGEPVRPTPAAELEGTVVLASRSETKRGEWQRFSRAPFRVRPTGSVAYKLALVAMGRADATWTLVPKHEWDVAAGAALVEAGGGCVSDLSGTRPPFNRETPLLDGFIAAGPALHAPILEFLRGGGHVPPGASAASPRGSSPTE